MTKSFTKSIIHIFFKKILFYSISFNIFIYVFIKILNLYNLELRQYIKDFLFYITTISLILGVIQIIIRIKNKIVKMVISFSCVLVVIVLFYLYQYIQLFDPYEEVVKRDNIKYVVEVYSFLHTTGEFHKYINPFVFKKEIEVSQYFGKGTVDVY